MALDPKAVGERIREIRVALGRQKGKKELSLKEFGDLLEVSDVSVLNYERGQIPKAEVLAKILELDQKKRTFDWLLLGTESKKLPISHGHINEGEVAHRLNQLRKAADILSRCRDMH
ncbi:MAG TPA: helix-turn-helix transcriptional regulator, partial [Candidatus Binatia bacterium]|nr:helix-turn-helix transcriptional regulator [Candidatus Binatia bacterium]